MLAGVPLAFFGTQKCSLESRWRFLSSEMLAGVPLAFFCPQKCSLGSRWHFFALKNARRGPAGMFLCLELFAKVLLMCFYAKNARAIAQA
jgi:hypothetical protein